MCLPFNTWELSQQYLGLPLWDGISSLSAQTSSCVGSSLPGVHILSLSSSILHATVKGFCLSDYNPLTTDFKVDHQVDLTKSFVPLHLSLEVRHRKSEIQSQTDIILLPRKKQTLVRNFQWPPGVKSHPLSTGSKKTGASPTTEFCQQL